MSGGIEYALRLREVEAEAARLRRDLDAVGHALGICYDHDHGCGGHGPAEEMVRAARDGCAARGRAIDAESETERLRRRVATLEGRLARVLRFAGRLAEWRERWLNIYRPRGGAWSRRGPRAGRGRE
jgi:hypothetical protein